MCNIDGCHNNYLIIMATINVAHYCCTTCKISSFSARSLPSETKYYNNRSHQPEQCDNQALSQVNLPHLELAADTHDSALRTIQQY